MKPADAPEGGSVWDEHQKKKIVNQKARMSRWILFVLLLLGCSAKRLGNRRRSRVSRNIGATDTDKQFKQAEARLVKKLESKIAGFEAKLLTLEGKFANLKSTSSGKGVLARSSMRAKSKRRYAVIGLAAGANYGA
jgi:hypothetical protein